ncbi:MAG: hypothetical protein JWO42_1506 [Chloroflexi bacterium]|nr:hypothetical protein [Chloroflexota bacterium]
MCFGCCDPTADSSGRLRVEVSRAVVEPSAEVVGHRVQILGKPARFVGQVGYAPAGSPSADRIGCHTEQTLRRYRNSPILEEHPAVFCLEVSLRQEWRRASLKRPEVETSHALGQRTCLIERNGRLECVAGSWRCHSGAKAELDLSLRSQGHKLYLKVIDAVLAVLETTKVSHIPAIAWPGNPQMIM